MGCCGSTPQPQDPAQAEIAGTLANLNTLPFTSQIQAAASKGQKVTINGNTYDFTGLGDADYESKYANTMAKAMLDIAQQYGPQYAQQAVDQLKQSDPTGTAMRANLYDSIQKQIQQAPPVSPVATNEQNSVLSQLQGGGQLDPQVAREVSQGVRGQQAALGNTLGNAAVSQEAGALNTASEGQAAQRQAAALNFLQSGSTPEDVGYRKTQQDLSNLGSFLAGTTPTAQFRQLSGAQSTAAPFNTGGYSGVGVNPNAGQQGLDYANSIYSHQMNWAQTQANPWTTGLGMGVQTAGVFGSLGGFNSAPRPNYNNDFSVGTGANGFYG